MSYHSHIDPFVEVDEKPVNTGIYGYNGTLVGAACATFIGSRALWDPLALVLTFVGSLLAVVRFSLLLLVTDQY
jgi:urea transporter